MCYSTISKLLYCLVSILLFILSFLFLCFYDLIFFLFFLLQFSLIKMLSLLYALLFLSLFLYSNLTFLILLGISSFSFEINLLEWIPCLIFLILNELPCYVKQCWFICALLPELSTGLVSHILLFIVCTAIHHCSSLGSLVFKTLRWNVREITWLINTIITLY